MCASKPGFFIFCVLLTACLAQPVTAATTEAGPAGLFRPTARQGQVLAAEPMVARERRVEVDFAALGGESPRTSDLPDSLRLNLFDNIAFTARRLPEAEAAASWDGTRQDGLWAGTLEGHEGSTALFVVRNGVMVGNVRVGGRLFQVQYKGDGVHAVAEVDVTAFPDELPPEEVTFTPEQLQAAESAREKGLQGGGGGDGNVYDTLILYTPVAMAGAGGVDAMRNWMTVALAETNQGYTSSQMTTRIRGVQILKVLYNDSGSMSTDRNRLQATSDGHMDGAHTLRDAYGADIVALIINSPGCGISYIMTTVSTAFAPFGVNVTMRSCAVGNYTFGHEIGHNQGARHDWFVDPTNNSPFTYNHGYVDPANQWRTVMAYSNDCGGCQRQLYFSNPNVNHPVTGNAMGRPEGQSQAADNHKTIDTTAPVISAFRARTDLIFMDSFETGDDSSWSLIEVVP